jgi:hypothetical protein
MFNQPDNLCAKPDSYQLKPGITSEGRSNEKACKATGRIHASPAVITNMQGIIRYSRKLESLQRRPNKVDIKNMDGEHRVEEVYIEQQKGKASTKGKEQLASNAAERERAYIRSAEKEKEMVKHIERTDLELRILREDSLGINFFRLISSAIQKKWSMGLTMTFQTASLKQMTMAGRIL